MYVLIFKLMFKNKLDKESLKQFGVPEKFKHLSWCKDICEGEDGGIYVLKDGKMHLLARNAHAYPISQGTSELPEDMVEIKNKLCAFAAKNRQLQTADEFIKMTQVKAKCVDFACVIENKDTPHRQEVFIKVANGYQKLSEPFFIGGAAKAFISLGHLVIFHDNKYEITDFIPVFAESYRIVFWGGERDIFALSMLFNRFDFMQFERIGRIEEVIQTEVSTLLKIKEDENKIALFNLSHHGLTPVCRLKPKQEFKIDKTTGAIRLCDFSLYYHGWLSHANFVYQSGGYERI